MTLVDVNDNGTNVVQCNIHHPMFEQEIWHRNNRDKHRNAYKQLYTCIVNYIYPFHLPSELCTFSRQNSIKQRCIPLNPLTAVQRLCTGKEKRHINMNTM